MAHRVTDQGHLRFYAGARTASSSRNAARFLDYPLARKGWGGSTRAREARRHGRCQKMFKVVLPSDWYSLLDLKLAEALDERASFRCNCGLSLNEPTTGRMANVTKEWKIPTREWAEVKSQFAILSKERFKIA